PKRLYPELVRGIAMVELFREGWVEPPQTHRQHFSTAVHQVLSILRQTGGTTAKELYERLCAQGAFRKIDRAQFSTLLRGMAKHEVLEAVPGGELILAPAGERIVESRDFYAAFVTTIEYVVEWAGQPIGMLPHDCIPGENEFMLLAGRRWQVVRIDRDVRRVLVQPAKGWKKPQFSGGGGGLHPSVMARMRRVLASLEEYPYLHENGRQLLNQGRSVFRESSLHECDLWSGHNTVRWFPWAGSRVHRTLHLSALAEGLKVSCDNLSLEYRSVAPEEFAAHLLKIAKGEYAESDVLAEVDVFLRDRFDEVVDPELLHRAYASEELDFEGARTSSTGLLQQLSP
ncbi:MAG TPA: hypothetical protein VK956_20290, partial [Verrucomicrobium sp.]|nr:hypothetical protein [Verrucomicrobium sp.]